MEGGADYRQELGRLGEDIACRYLKENGHTILERNWRSGHLEVDIISLDDFGIHFVEVKTRQFSMQSPPQNNVDGRKQKRIAKAAMKYMKTANGQKHCCAECNFDIVAVTLIENGWHMEWMPNAYIPIYY